MFSRSVKPTIICLCLLLLAGCPKQDLDVLQADDMNGRAPLSAESIKAQDYILQKLTPFTTPLRAAPSYKQTFENGTNILGAIRGSDLANEYVILGAHYDHLGNNCSAQPQSDNICNGASDNASGVSALLHIAESMKNNNYQPRRTIVFAFWDGEETGLTGSKYYVNNPLVPLKQTIAYLNNDILGTNLLPSVKNSMFVIGAETGGLNMLAMIQAAAKKSPLTIRYIGKLFGHNRGDHSSFINKGVPAAFFTDSTGSCYHSSEDTTTIIDYPKLDEQILVIEEVAKNIANTAYIPHIQSSLAATTYSDAQMLLSFISDANKDQQLFSAASQAIMREAQSGVSAIVRRGYNSFNAADEKLMAEGAEAVLKQIGDLPCNGFLDK